MRIVFAVSCPQLHPLQVFAWDTKLNDFDRNETDGRSYISAVSEVILDGSQLCDGRAKNTMGEARMDIEDSEMAYLGYHDSESYGLTWKVGEEVLLCGAVFCWWCWLSFSRRAYQVRDKVLVFVSVLLQLQEAGRAA